MTRGQIVGSLSNKRLQIQQAHLCSNKIEIYDKAFFIVLENRLLISLIVFSEKFIFKQLQIYDVTSYVEEHPGGDAILAHAGDDSTEGFYG